MSQAAAMNPANYTSGDDRYVRFGEDFLNRRIAEAQRTILEAVVNHQRVIIVSGNGPGKSYAVAMLKLGFLFTNPDSIVLGTSGSYSQYVDTMWKPMETMFKRAKEQYGLPGKAIGGQQPQLKIDTEWYAKVVSPRDPGELEGRHGPDVLVVIEEADKRFITEEHFDSGGSSVTDMNDRMVAVANPPEDESNIVYEKMQSDRWHVIQFDSFESHNAQIDMGDLADEKIPGLVDLITIADDWEAWNGVSWPLVEDNYPGEYPGIEVLKQEVEDGELEEEQLVEWLRPGAEIARYAHEERTDLDTRWYRRRAGVIPPDSATVHRPFTVADVQDAFNRLDAPPGHVPKGIGIDVARKGGDFNVVVEVIGPFIHVKDRWQGLDHVENEQRIKDMAQDWRGVPLAIDANAEGSGLADNVLSWHDPGIRFDAGSKPADESAFYCKWDEGLYEMGKFLRDEGALTNRFLREELMMAARTVRYEEKYYSSRDTEVFKATPKDKVKEAVGRSPDVLDAAYMAVWAARGNAERRERLVW